MLLYSSILTFNTDEESLNNHINTLRINKSEVTKSKVQKYKSISIANTMMPMKVGIKI